MNYYDIYQKRLNRYGNTYQERVQTEREKLFDKYLFKSIYRVEFMYENEVQVGSFERYKQDETETLHYLLTHTSLNIPNGTILKLPDKDNKLCPWMVYYMERIKASGYNRYIMLRMTHFLTWEARDKSRHRSWAYLYGQENNMLKDELKSRSRTETIYNEDLKNSFFILPCNEFIKKDDYFVVGEKPFQAYYRVTGYDFQSSPGVEYVTIDPVYEYDLSPTPVQLVDDNPDEFYWFDRGV